MVSVENYNIPNIEGVPVELENAGSGYVICNDGVKVLVSSDPSYKLAPCDNHGGVKEKQTTQESRQKKISGNIKPYLVAIALVFTGIIIAKIVSKQTT
jgi:hypothetical protein